MNPLQPDPMMGLAGNPLLLTGLQLLNNSRRGPRRGLFEGVPQALMQAQQGQYMMQQMQRQQAEQDYLQRERARQDAERQAGAQTLGKIGNALQAQQGYDQRVNALEATGGGPMRPRPPTPDIMGMLLQGPPELQKLATTTMLSQMSKTPTYEKVGYGDMLIDPKTGKVVAQGPQKERPPIRVGNQLVDPVTMKPLYTAPDTGAGAAPFFIYQPITDSSGKVTGIVKLDGRGGQDPSLVKVPGMDVAMRPQDNPALQRDIAQEKAAGASTGENTAKREFGMRDLKATTSMARNLLDGKGIDGKGGASPTHSGVGTAVDAVTGFFGKSLDSADTASQLKAIGGVLTSKMPRMEGPQSDADRIQYQQMAGEVGNSMLPISRRKAALDVIDQLWAKYDKSGEVGAGGANPGGANQGGIKFMGFE